MQVTKSPVLNIRQIFCLCFLACILIQAESHVIHRRNVFQMCNLLNIHTNRTCVDFDSYGCFCGYGQQGRKPLDEVDACCKKHDDCYGQVKCYFWSAIWVGYDYNCNNDKCYCADQNACAASACDCDIKLAQCIRDAKYHVAYKDYDRTLCI